MCTTLMRKNINILKSIWSKICFLLLFVLFFSLNIQAQSFSVVGCRAPYETRTMEIYNNKLIHCGFDSICNINVEGIAKWNDSSWSKLGGLNTSSGGASMTFQVYNNQLYTGGNFNSIGGKTTNKIARWNGIQWDSVGKGLDAQGNLEKITSMAVYKNELYVAGLFRQVDGVTGYNHIAVWNGTSWRKIGGLFGSLPEVYCMAVYKNELYVGGLFSQAGFTPANFIARWDGQQWRRVGRGTNYIVQAMVVDTVRDLLYVAGGFDHVNDTLKCKVAQWDGTNWTAVGSDTIFSSNVLTLEMYHGYLYAAGNASKFDQKETILARWDGVTWEPIPGFDGPIGCLKTYNDELYIGGGFTKINNDSIPYLAKYYSADSVLIGIENNKTKNNKLEVYPNPVENSLNIKSDLIFEKYLIYSIEGKLVLEIKKPVSNKIEITRLSKGEYILKAIAESDKEYTARFRK